MKILISNKSKTDFIDFLKEENIAYEKTLDNPNLDKRIADHPDLSVFVLDNKNIVVDKTLYDYYKEKFSDINVIKGDSVSLKYPYDSIYNIVKFKNYYIHNEFSEKNIVSYLKDKNFKHLLVKQGYSRCSTIVAKDFLMTCDYGIYKKLKDILDVVLLKEEDIKLDGFNKGFIGGTCGFFDKDRLVFNGDIKKLKSYDIIYKKCREKNIDLIYPECELLDTGSLMKIG